jgi:hypothetical protein
MFKLTQIMFLGAKAILSCLLAISVTSHAATYYLSTDGNNSNPGTRAKPWASLQESIWQMKAGDTLIIRGGTYHAASFTDIAKPSKGEITTIRAEKGEEVLFDGRVPTASVVGKNRWTLISGERWTIEYSGKWKWLDGLWVDEQYFPQVKSLNELNAKTWHLDEVARRITLHLSENKNPSDLKMEFRLGFMITIDTPYWNIEGITANYYTQYGIGVWKTHDVTIRRCQAHYNGGGGIEGVEAGSLLIEDNHTSYNGSMGGPGWSSGIHLFAPTNKKNVVRRNISHHNWDSSEYHTDGNGFSIDKGYANGGAEVYENIAYANGGRGLDVMETSDTFVHHNTFFNNSLDSFIDNQGELSIFGEVSLKGLKISDNILYATRKNFPLVIWNELDAQQIESDHNLFFNSDSPSLAIGRISKGSVSNYTIEDWQKLSGHEVHSLNADPKLQDPKSNRFAPLPDSPVIGKGTKRSTIGRMHSGLMNYLEKGKNESIDRLRRGYR